MNALKVLRTVLSEANVRTNEGKMVDSDKIRSLLENEGVSAFDFQHPEGFVTPVGSYDGVHNVLLTHSRTENSGLVFELLVKLDRQDVLKAYEKVALDIRDAAAEAYRYLKLPKTERRPSAEEFVEQLRVLGVYTIDPFEDLVEFLFNNGILEFLHATYSESGGFIFRKEGWNDRIKIVRCEEEFETPADQLKEIANCARKFFCPDNKRT